MRFFYAHAVRTVRRTVPGLVYTCGYGLRVYVYTAPPFGSTLPHFASGSIYVLYIAAAHFYRAPHRLPFVLVRHTHTAFLPRFACRGYVVFTPFTVPGYCFGCGSTHAGWLPVCCVTLFIYFTHHRTFCRFTFGLHTHRLLDLFVLHGFPAVAYGYLTGWLRGSHTVARLPHAHVCVTIPLYPHLRTHSTPLVDSHRRAVTGFGLPDTYVTYRLRMLPLLVATVCRFCGSASLPLRATLDYHSTFTCGAVLRSRTGYGWFTHLPGCYTCRLGYGLRFATMPRLDWFTGSCCNLPARLPSFYHPLPAHTLPRTVTHGLYAPMRLLPYAYYRFIAPFLPGSAVAIRCYYVLLRTTPGLYSSTGCVV